MQLVPKNIRKYKFTYEKNRFHKKLLGEVQERHKIWFEHCSLYFFNDFCVWNTFLDAYAHAYSNLEHSWKSRNSKKNWVSKAGHFYYALKSPPSMKVYLCAVKAKYNKSKRHLYLPTYQFQSKSEYNNNCKREVFYAYVSPINIHE